MGFWLEGREYPLGWREDKTLLVGGKIIRSCLEGREYALDWREENTLLIGGKRLRS